MKLSQFYVYYYRFYGVIVTDRGSCGSITDYGAAFPDPQPRPTDNDYYIAAGWNDLSEVPDRFTAGRGRSTMAIRLGVEETYSNPRLNNYERYCVIAFVNIESGVENVSQIFF